MHTFSKPAFNCGVFTTQLYLVKIFNAHCTWQKDECLNFFDSFITSIIDTKLNILKTTKNNVHNSKKCSRIKWKLQAQFKPYNKCKEKKTTMNKIKHEIKQKYNVY